MPGSEMQPPSACVNEMGGFLSFSPSRRACDQVEGEIYYGNLCYDAA
jgi:hypothetical protein